MTISVWLCGDKKTPLPEMEEELMMEAWRLLKDEGKGGQMIKIYFSHIFGL